MCIGSHKLVVTGGNRRKDAGIWCGSMKNSFKKSDKSVIKVRMEVEYSKKRANEFVVSSIGDWRVGKGERVKRRNWWRSIVRESGKEVEGE